MKMSRLWLNRIIMVLLVALAVLMLSEGWLGLNDGAAALIAHGGRSNLARKSGAQVRVQAGGVASRGQDIAFRKMPHREAMGQYQ
ncbi:MAG: hypothetical protein V4724_37695 [Pseudomonadota bacterium]